MDRSTWNFTTSRIALAAAVVAGLAAAPFGLDSNKLQNTVVAQTADPSADVSADVDASADDDAADARANADVDADANAEGSSTTSADADADVDGDVDADASLSADSAVSDESGEAEEFVEDADSRVGGTGSVGISSGEQRFADPASVNVTESPDFERYSEAAENNDLEKAAMALAAAADRPVTEDYVAEVNEQLGVQTSLTAEQIAEAANEEPLPY